MGSWIGWRRACKLGTIDPESGGSEMPTLEKSREPAPLAGHLRTRPPRQKPTTGGKFSAQLALQRAFVAAPTD